MSRSTYIYLAEYFAWGEQWPAAAFTVKHELVSWLKSQDNPGEYRVFRMSDGDHGKDPALMVMSELLN